MIREYVGKKAADLIERTRYGRTKVGKISANILDDERLDDTLVGSFQHLYFRYSPVSLALTVNAVSWISVIFLPNVLSKIVLALTLIFPKGGLLLIIPAFASTMVCIYSLLRVWRPERLETNDTENVMRSYEQQMDSLLTWKLWVVSCGIGGVNSILLIITYFVMTEEWQHYSR